MRPGSSPHTRGTRATWSRSSSPWRDHPRIRGEHAWHGGARTKGLGIIPAYAGNTTVFGDLTAKRQGSSPHTRGTPFAPPVQMRKPRDHPRIRGEHAQGGRGKPRHHGIIPAYAGNTQKGGVGKTTLAGSSPHTRGTPTSQSSTRP